MKDYEVVFIIDPSSDDSQVGQQVDTVKEIIASGNGKVLETEIWGRRRLAYEIKKKKEGTYVLIRFKGGPALLAELARRFKLNELILRHLTVVCHEPESQQPAGEPGGTDEEESYETDSRTDS
ncbi:MAG: 30S ribosomal protein S6 [Candidatus Eisenbacteria bacterium]|nr:30S ribosomal protein S6 [Candidatus Eisenbacteria bacterium]